jgi:hypothetical protein
VFKPHCSAQQGAQRSFLAANALFDALSAFVPCVQAGVEMAQRRIAVGR